jgi:hypothetical protein
MPFLPVENAQDDVFAVDRRLQGNAEIDRRPRMLRPMRPSCGARISAMFIPESTLMRTVIAGQ